MQQYYTKKNVSSHEYKLQQYVYELGIVNVPKIISYQKKTMKMEKINHPTIADNYGEDFNNVPNHIVEKVRKTVELLFQHSIVYPDITGYNFMYDENADILWIIDFEHATQIDPFVAEFIGGKNTWNPSFT